MASAPIAPGAIAAFEASAGYAFPAAYRTRMAERNGGIVRIGPLHFWLFAIPGSGHRFPHKVTWMGRDCRDLPSFATVAKGFETFPAEAVPIGLRLFNRSMDGVLCLVRSAERPRELLDEVWLWHWYRKPFRRLLDATQEIWRDDPFRVPRPKQDWRVKRAKFALPAGLAPRARAARGTDDRPEDLGWQPACAVEILGTRIGISDGAGGDWDEGLRAATQPGAHELSLRVLAFGKERRVGSLRLLRRDRDASGRTPLGSLDVDLASVLLVDLDPVLSCEEVVLDALLDRLPDLALVDKLVGSLSFGPTTMVQVSSGLGDGTYPVFQLHAGSSPVGIEIEFLPADAGSPGRRGAA